MSDFSLCKHFGTCGGCTEQTLSYQEELNQKELYIKKLFAPFNTPILPILPCDFPWRYRNKMEFSFSDTLDGSQFLGLMMRSKKGKVVTLQECLLSPLWFVDVLEEVKIWWSRLFLKAYYPPKNRGFFRSLTLREGIRTKEKMAILTVANEGEFDEDLFVSTILRRVKLDSIILRRQIIQKNKPTLYVERVLFGNDHIREELFHEKENRFLLFKIRPSSFFQPNTLQAEKIYNTSMLLAQLEKGCQVLDLYCGTGAIGLFASFDAKNSVGIEINEDAVIDAQENGAVNGIKNWDVFQGDVGKFLSQEFKPDCVFLDPPRAGLSQETIEKLLKMAPSKIVYISCNPETQVLNTKEFINNSYRLKAIQSVDQFPHTSHIENIIALEKNK